MGIVNNLDLVQLVNTYAHLFESVILGQLPASIKEKVLAGENLLASKNVKKHLIKGK
jgi:hypothetical protein